MTHYITSRRCSAVLFATALPCTIALLLTAPRAVSVAHGCTGGSAATWANLSDGWHQLSIDASGTAAAPTDAVVVLRGKLKGLEPSAALAQANVAVIDDVGASMPGSLELIDGLGTVVGLADLRDAAIVWRPSKPMTPGKKYLVTWQVGSVGSTAELVTVTASQSPAPPNAEPAKVVATMAVAGPYVDCSAVANCGPGSLKLVFHQATTKAPGLGVSIAAGAAPANATYQVLELAQIGGKGTLTGLQERRLIVAAAGSTPPKTRLSASFSDDLPEYCVKLTATDLRNGQKLESPELCASPLASPPADPSTAWEGAIGACNAPPHPDLVSLWCASHSVAKECGGTGVGGSSADGGAPEPSSASGGCAAAPRRETPVLLFVAIGVVGLAACGRRLFKI